MAKKKEPSDRKVHKVTFKKEPVWISLNVLGKYEGIKWRFTYREYNSPDADEVIKTFVFQWPGVIPDDKAYAEKGIKALFLKSLEDKNFSFQVIKDDASMSDKDAEDDILNKLDELDDDI